MPRRALITLALLMLAGIGPPATPAPEPGEEDEKIKWLLDAKIKEPPAKKDTEDKDTQGKHQFRRLEFRSEVRVRRFVETGVRRYVASAEYLPVPRADQWEWCPRTRTSTGLFHAAEHCYQKGKGDKRTTLELDLHRHPAGGFEMYFFGTQPPDPPKESEGAEKSPGRGDEDREVRARGLAETKGDLEGRESRIVNKDLKAMSNLFGELLAELAGAKLGGPNDDYSLYPLSYVQADRAVAILKTLGYEVVEYSRTAKDKTTTAEPDRIFNGAPEGVLSRPAIINLIDADETSLVQQTEPTVTLGGKVTKDLPSASVLTGGQRLDAVTDGVALQQLLIVFDKEDRRALYELLRLLNEEIDVAARQILIEALVVELDRDSLKDIGFDLTAGEDGGTLTAIEQNGVPQPLQLEIVRPSPQTLFNFNLKLRALVSDGTANVLSRPSVLVLDGRQARIKVGDEVPFTAAVSLSGTLSTTATAFLSTGIILNLRPRASADNSQVTFQVETIISSAGRSREQPETGILLAPEVQSRQVQTLVRVANDTPFVIGGLIDRSIKEDLSKVPGLSKIPGLGRLFRKKTFDRQNKEVIVVITPHIIPVEDDASSFAIPRESELLDSFDSELFRDSYRLRRSDIFDLEFISKDEHFKTLQQRVRDLVGGITKTPFEESPPLDRAAVEEELLLYTRKLQSHVEEKGAGADDLGQAFHTFYQNVRAKKATWPEKEDVRTLIDVYNGIVPGEWILVHRMMIGLLEKPCDSGEKGPIRRVKTKFEQARQRAWQTATPCDVGRAIDLANVIYFDKRELTEISKDQFSLDVEFLQARMAEECEKADSAFLTFAQDDASDGSIKKPPVASFACKPLTGSYDAALEKGKVVVLNEDPSGRRDQSPLEMLQSVLAFERMLELNPEEAFPRTLKAFHEGREIVFPTGEDLAAGTHLIDRETAKRFYQTLFYYEAFLDEFTAQKEKLEETVLPVLEAIARQEELARSGLGPRSAPGSRVAPARAREPALGSRVRVRVVYRGSSEDPGSTVATIAGSTLSGTRAPGSDTPSPAAARPAPDSRQAESRESEGASEALLRRLVAAFESRPAAGGGRPR